MMATKSAWGRFMKLWNAPRTRNRSKAAQILMANYNHEHYPDAKIGHVNHPVTKFYKTTECRNELIQYLDWLLDEYLYRFGKEHQNRFWVNGFSMWQTFPYFEFCVSKTYVNNTMTDVIEEIRNYIMTKPHTRPLTWTNREKPDWWKM